MKNLNDEMLGAYLDGEIEGEDRSRIVEAVARDPNLALRLTRMRKADDLLRESVAEWPEQDFDPLAEFILGSPASPVSKRPWDAFRGVGGASLLAAALVVGVFAGQVSVPATSFGQDKQLGLIAQGSLARSLSEDSSGRTGQPVKILMSFRVPDGHFCRQFTGAGDGVACREGSNWRILALAQSRQSVSGGYVTASGEGSPGVEATIDSLGSITPLDRSAESSAIQSKWR
jgi:hypothetical protein